MKELPSRLYAEIRQGRPFGLPARELAVGLLRTGDVLHHAIGRALAPFAISQEQYNALRILRGAGPAGHPTLEISRRLISRSPNITRLLDKLIGKGLARRDRDADDRRQALVRITPEGVRLLARADVALDALLARLSGLKPSEVRGAIRLLDRVREAVEVTTVREQLESGASPESEST